MHEEDTEFISFEHRPSNNWRAGPFSPSVLNFVRPSREAFAIGEDEELCPIHL